MPPVSVPERKVVTSAAHNCDVNSHLGNPRSRLVERPSPPHKLVVFFGQQAILARVPHVTHRTRGKIRIISVVACEI
jgi:hypothetical protein